MTEPEISTLGALIRDARVRKGLSLRELARRLDKAPSYISDIEYDRRVPSEAVLRDISDVLELDFEQLLAKAGRFGEEAERYRGKTPLPVPCSDTWSGAALRDDELNSLSEKVDELEQRRRDQAEQP